jgi:hypothetical protein
MHVPADDLLEGMRLRRRAQLELRLVARADHAEDLGVLPREVPDRHRGGRRGAERGQVIAAHHRLHAARVGVEQEHRRLVVDDPPPVEVVRPVAPGLEAENAARAVEAALEAVERILVPDGLAHHREVVGIARGHGGEDLLHRLEGGLARQDVGDHVPFGHDHQLVRGRFRSVRHQ